MNYFYPTCPICSQRVLQLSGQDYYVATVHKNFMRTQTSLPDSFEADHYHLSCLINSGLGTALVYAATMEAMIIGGYTVVAKDDTYTILNQEPVGEIQIVNDDGWIATYQYGGVTHLREEGVLVSKKRTYFVHEDWDMPMHNCILILATT